MAVSFVSIIKSGLFKGGYQDSIKFHKIAHDEATIMELLKHHIAKSKSLTESFLKDPSEAKKQAKELLQRINALMRQTTV